MTSITALALFLSLPVAYAEEVDKVALRASLTLPAVNLEVSFSSEIYLRERAEEKLRELQPRLLAEKDNPTVLVAVGRNLKDMGEEAGAQKYFQQVVTLLREKPLPSVEDRATLVEAYYHLEAIPSAKAGVTSLQTASPPLAAFWSAKIAELETLLKLSEEPSILENIQIPGNAKKVSDWLASRAAVRALYQKACDLNPGDAKPRRALGLLLSVDAGIKGILDSQQGRPATPGHLGEASLKVLREALKCAPTDPEIASELFWSVFVVEMSKAPEVSSASLATKLSREALDTLAAAERSLEKIAEGKGVDARIATEARGVAAAIRGDYATAILWLQKTTAYSPDLRRKQLMLDVLLLAKKFDEAAAYGKGLLKEVNLPSLWIKTAKALEMAGKTEEASALILSGLVEHPNSPILRLARSVELLRDPSGSKLGEASVTLSELVLIAQTAGSTFRFEVTFQRCVLFALLGDIGEAKRMLDQLIRADPGEEKYRKARLAIGNSR